MNSWSGTAALLTLIFLTACGEKPQQAPAPQTAPAHPFQQQQSVLDKSRGVEQTLQKNSEEQRQDLEQQTK